MSRVRPQLGFGLIELMIALVLGLLVIGAAFAVFQSNQATYRANEGLNRIQENARVAFELMSRDLRAAGGSACSSASVMETADANSLLFRDTPVTGTATALTVTSGDDAAYRVTGSTAQSVTLDNAQIADAKQAFNNNDWLILCNARKSFIVQANVVTTDTITFKDPLPSSYVPTADEFAPPAAIVIARLRSTRWYLDGTTLRVSRLGGAGEAVAEGVQNLTVSYLQSGGGDYVATPSDWAAVTAVRVNMTLIGQNVDGRPFTRSVSNVVSLRSRTL
jgi:type IV pilus assembly protein PilW